MQAIFYLIPECSPVQALLDHILNIAIGFALNAQAIGDILENRFREGIGSLEDHADTLA